MASTNPQNFDKRMERILRKHQKMSNGYVPALTEDGLIVPVPKRRFRLPWRSGLFLLVSVVAFKAMLHSVVGPAAYDERVARLASGTQVERAGAWIMTADPITIAISEQIGALVP